MRWFPAPAAPRLIRRILTLWEPMLRQREGKCVQVLTLETLGGHSNRERFANTASLVPSHSLIVLANALPSSPPGPGPCSVWAVRYRTSSDATGDAVELQAVAEFQVAQPILSVAAAPGSDNPAELFAVQPIGIQRHMLDALMCAPARVSAYPGARGGASEVLRTALGRVIRPSIVEAAFVEDRYLRASRTPRRTRTGAGLGQP